MRPRPLKYFLKKPETKLFGFNVVKLVDKRTRRVQRRPVDLGDVRCHRLPKQRDPIAKENIKNKENKFFVPVFQSALPPSTLDFRPIRRFHSRDTFQRRERRINRIPVLRGKSKEKTTKNIREPDLKGSDFNAQPEIQLTFIEKIVSIEPAKKTNNINVQSIMTTKRYFWFK